MLNITGTLKVKNAEQKVSEKFKKREFVLTDNSSQYPQHVLFQLTQDRCNLIEGYKVGDEIKVSFNLRGREWQNPQGEIKFFNSLDVWRIEGVNSGSSSASSFEEQEVPVANAGPEDDLPF